MCVWTLSILPFFVNNVHILCMNGKYLYTFWALNLAAIWSGFWIDVCFFQGLTRLNGRRLLLKSFQLKILRRTWPVLATFPHSSQSKSETKLILCLFFYSGDLIPYLLLYLSQHMKRARKKKEKKTQCLYLHCTSLYCLHLRNISVLIRLSKLLIT